MQFVIYVSKLHTGTVEPTANRQQKYPGACILTGYPGNW